MFPEKSGSTQGLLWLRIGIGKPFISAAFCWPMQVTRPAHVRAKGDSRQRAWRQGRE